MARVDRGGVRLIGGCVVKGLAWVWGRSLARSLRVMEWRWGECWSGVSIVGYNPDLLL